MAGNSIGQLFRVTTCGESHGVGLMAIIDGVPPGIELSEADLQKDLDRRKPGTSKFATQRKEPDEVEIISGVFEGKTTGTSIGLLIRNTDQKSKDYGNIAQTFRRVMQTIPIPRSMVSVIIVAVAVQVHVKLQCVWQRVRLPRNSCLRNSVLKSAVMSPRLALKKPRNWTGMKFQIIRSSVVMLMPFHVLRHWSRRCVNKAPVVARALKLLPLKSQ